MKPQYQADVPQDEWGLHLPRLLAPLEPGEFDLTPVLRARYGNQLREDIVWVRLFTVDRQLGLRLEVAGQVEPLIVPFSEVIIAPEGDPISLVEQLLERQPYPVPPQWAEEDSRRDWVLALLPHLLEAFDTWEVAVDLHLFSPRYMELLARVQKRQTEEKASLYEEIAHFRQGVSFFRDCTERLALNFHPEIKVRLVDELANRLRQQPAFGVLSSELKTYWDEIGVIAEEGSDNLLYWTLMDELDAIALASLRELPEVEQFALWAAGSGGNDGFDTYAYERYPTNMKAADTDLADVAVDIRNRLLGEAMDGLGKQAREYLGY